EAFLPPRTQSAQRVEFLCAPCVLGGKWIRERSTTIGQRCFEPSSYTIGTCATPFASSGVRLAGIDSLRGAVLICCGAWRPIAASRCSRFTSWNFGNLYFASVATCGGS